MKTKSVNSYYLKNRKNIMKRLNKRYAEDENFREQAKQKSKERYHRDDNYKINTIRRAIERYNRLKNQQTKGKN